MASHTPLSVLLSSVAPEGVLTADRGTLCIVLTALTGTLYFKATQAVAGVPDNVGWISTGVIPVVSDGSSITGNGTAASPLASPVGASSVPGIYFGTGPSGNVVFDGVSTVLGLVPAAGVYTMNSDIHPNNMTVDVGVRVKGNGYAIFGSGTLTNNGQIDDDGNDAVGGVAGAARTATMRYRSGTTGGAAGTGGGATGNSPKGYFPAAAAAAGGAAGVAGTPGGTGQGGGGGGGAAVGGSGGAIVNGVIINDATMLVRGAGGSAGSNSTSMDWASGGGSGGANVGTRGAGGAGGGAISVFFPTITGTGRISARGGLGGVASAGGGCGGGGGGGGGMVIVGYLTRSGALTIDATGGTGGAGDGVGAAGGNGGDGRVLLFGP